MILFETVNEWETHIIEISIRETRSESIVNFQYRDVIRTDVRVMISIYVHRYILCVRIVRPRKRTFVKRAQKPRGNV